MYFIILTIVGQNSSEEGQFEVGWLNDKYKENVL